MTESEHRWLPRSAVIERLGVHKRTLGRWVDAGKLRERRDDHGRVHYHADDVALLPGKTETSQSVVSSLHDLETALVDAKSARRRKILSREHDKPTLKDKIQFVLSTLESELGVHVPEDFWDD